MSNGRTRQAHRGVGLTAAALISALALSACGGDAAGDEEDEITSSGDGELFDLLPRMCKRAEC